MHELRISILCHRECWNGYWFSFGYECGLQRRFQIGDYIFSSTYNKWLRYCCIHLLSYCSKCFLDSFWGKLWISRFSRNDNLEMPKLHLLTQMRKCSCCEASLTISVFSFPAQHGSGRFWLSSIIGLVFVLWLASYCLFWQEGFLHIKFSLISRWFLVPASVPHA